MPIQKTHLSALACAAILACALPAIAQNLPGFGANGVVDVQAEVLPQDQIENRYRIGIDCAPASEALRAHLRLQEDTGLLVKGVLDASPGGRAGIKRHDIIVAADGQPLTSVQDLVVAVNEAKESEMTLAIIHAGEEHTIKVTPEERNPEEIARLRNGFANRLGRQNPLLQGLAMGDMQAEIQRAIEEMEAQLGPMQNGFRMHMGPGIMFPNGAAPSVGNPGVNGWSSSKSSMTRSFQSNGEKVTITIDRDDDKPAQIKVQRGGDSWELTEKELDQLPKDIRALVQSQLNGRGTLQGLMGPMGFPTLPRKPARPGNNNNRRMEDRFDGVELKLQELQDAIRSIQGNE